MRVLIVTGTGTDVGKTVATAAIAACARARGQTVAVVKPIQTGVGPSEPGDLAEVNRLTGIEDLHEYARFDDPLAPATAARRAGAETPTAVELATFIAALENRDLVLIEGAGGALVRLTTAGETLLDVAAELSDHELDVVLVTPAGLGSLHAAAATAQVITAAHLRLAGLVVGDWPDRPGLAERENLTDLGDYTATPIAGILPHGTGRLGRSDFAALAIRSLSQTLGGVFDLAEFTASQISTTGRLSAPAQTPAASRDDTPGGRA